jgi:hypothetical protein
MLGSLRTVLNESARHVTCQLFSFFAFLKADLWFDRTEFYTSKYFLLAIFFPNKEQQLKHGTHTPLLHFGRAFNLFDCGSSRVFWQRHAQSDICDRRPDMLPKRCLCHSLPRASVRTNQRCVKPLYYIQLYCYSGIILSTR